MFSKNLKYYRLRKQMSKKELAEKVNISPMAVTYYEQGLRKPSMEILKKMADVLGVKVTDFLTVRNENINVSFCEFRKNSTLSVSQQEYIRESVEEFFGRFMTVVDILGGEILPETPKCHNILLSESVEENASLLRKHLGFSEDGPIEELTGKLENKGILVYECDIDSNKFSGMNGFVNERPYIVLNKNMNPERKRSTIVHELAHLMFKWPEDKSDREREDEATAIGGAFLFPKSDVIRELGIRRTAVTRDMISVAIEYGISMWLLVKRAELCNVITAAVARSFYIEASKMGWKTSEPSRIKEEEPSVFKLLVYRAVNEEEICVQRGAELLRVPYNEIMAMRSLCEV